MTADDWKRVTRCDSERPDRKERYITSLDTARIRTASLENLLFTAIFEGDFSKHVPRYKLPERRGFVHSHTHYELLHIAAGRMDMYVEDACLPLESGSVVIIPPGVFHKGETMTDELIYQNAQFYYSEQPSPVCADLYRHFDAVFARRGVMRTAASETVQAQFYELAALGRRGSAYESLMFMARFLTLMLTVCDDFSPIPKNFCAERVVVDSNDLNIRYEISTYLNHCYKRNPSMGELAAGLHMSE